MPSKDCHTHQRQMARIELELKRDIYSEMSWYPGNHRSGCVHRHGTKKYGKGGNSRMHHGWSAGQLQTKELGITTTEYSCKGFIMHMCTSNVYWITLKLFNKTINVEFCIYFVSLMKLQLQGQNKCKYTVFTPHCSLF